MSLSCQQVVSVLVRTGAAPTEASTTAMLSLMCVQGCTAVNCLAFAHLG